MNTTSMNLQDAIIAVLEEWRKRRGTDTNSGGVAIAAEGTEPRVAGEMWSRMINTRKDTGKKRQLTVIELDALASFFGVNPETIILEARQRLGQISGSEKQRAQAG